MKRSLKRTGMKAAIFALFLSIFVAAQQTASAAGNDGRINFSSVYSTYTDLITGQNTSGATGLKKYATGSSAFVSSPLDTVTVCNTGTPTFTTLAAAVTDANTNFPAGGRTYNVCAGFTETAPTGGYVLTSNGGAGSEIIFQKDPSTTGANPTITAFGGQTSGNLNDAIIKIIGGDYITINGFTLQENTANTTIATAATNNATEFGIALFYTTTTNGAQNNSILNNTITLNRAYLNSIGIYSNTRTNSTALTTAAEATTASGSNSNNKVYGNTMSNMNYGIVFIGAGTTIAAIDTGNDIGGTSAATGNTITNWGGGSTLTSFTSLTGSNYCVFMNQQINDNFSFNTITSASLTQTVTTGGYLKNYSVASPAAGTVTTSNINNNTVTVTNAGASGANIGLNSQGLTALSTATININNNSVLNFTLNGASSTQTFTGITNLSAPGTLNMNSNTVRGLTTTTASGQVAALTNSGAVVNTININNNRFGDATAGFVTYSVATSSALFGISTSGGAATAALNITGNDVRGIVYTVVSTGANTYIVNSAATLSQNISTNTFTNLTVNTTGSVTFISNSVALPSTSSFATTSNNSIVTQFTKSGAGGTVTLLAITTTPSSVAGSTKTEQNNNFSNITLTGATTMAGWQDQEGASGGGSTKNISNNTFTNWTCGTSAVNVMTVQYAGGNSSISSNTINNITAAAAITGISTPSTNGGTSLAISLNTINTLSSSGAATVAPITSASASTTTNIFKNKIYDISGSNASSVVSAITISGSSTTVNIYNNLIGDLRTPIATSTSPADPIRGINLTSTTATSTINVSFNTVYLNATSSGTNFGTSALYHTTSTTATTATLVMRNNILTNVSTATGTGLTVAYRRSSTTLTNYGAASNNNDFYAGTPSATNLIFYDGTNAVQTLAAYKALVAPRDSNSVSENPPFLSTTGSSANFLHINSATPTQLESGGIAVAGITDDFDAQTRNPSTPDIGADEFAGTLLDVNGPTITYTNLLNTSSTANRTLTISVVDPSGVPTSGIGLPVIYYRKGTSGAYSSTQCTFVSGSNYNCVINYSLVTGGSVAVGDTIQYYVAAQDNAGNVSVNPSTGASGLTPNPPSASTPPTTLNQYSIVNAINGSYNVGTAETYTSLTNAGGIFEFINNNEVTGNITINITSDLTNEGGTIPLNTTAGGFTITIKPSGAARLITGTATATQLIKINGASNVVIDGSLAGGTDRSLTLSHINTAATSVVWFGSVGTTPITNEVLKNSIVINGANTSSAVYISDAGTLGNQGYFSNITVQNNNVQRAFVGIFANGGTTPQTGSNVTYTQNTLNTTGANAIRNIGLYMQGVNGATVSNNTVGNFNATNDENDTGIWLASGTINATVSGNTVSTLGYTGTSAFAPFGIRDSGGATASGNAISTNAVSAISTNGTTAVYGIENSSGGTLINRNNVQGVINTSTSTYGAYGINISAGNNAVIRNNFVSNITGDMTGGGAFSTQFGIFGIRIATGTGHQIYNNSVNLYGLRSGTATTNLLTASFAIVSTASTGMDVRNNIFANNITGGTTSIANVSVYLPISGTSAMNLTWNNNSYYSGTVAGASGIAHVGTTYTTPPAGPTTYAGLYTAANFNPADTTNTLNLRTYTSILSTAGTNDNASLASTGVVPFVSSNDLHLIAGAPEFNVGATIASVTVDYDGDTRPQGAGYDIGADEIIVVATPGTLAFSSATYSVGEAGGTVTLTVNRTGGTDGAVTANYTLGGGTATGGATCATGVDYVNTGGTVSFANGEASKTFNVTICQDTTFEGNETFTATLAGATGGATIGTPNPATVTIVDDETQPTISINDVAQNEGNSLTTAFNFTVSLSNASSQTVTVNYATANGTAIAPGDYATTNGTVTFTAGQISQTVSVQVNGDTTPETDETFFVNLTSPTNATIFDAQGQGTIINDDVDMTAPVISYTPLPAKGSASSSTLVVTVTDDVAVQSVFINYAIGAGATQTVPCSSAGGSNYNCIIDETGGNNQTVSYYVLATDTFSNASRNPATSNNGYAIGTTNIQPGTYDTLNVLNGSLGGNVTVNANFSYTGAINSSGGTLTLGCAATIDAGNANKFVNATITKNFCSAPQTFTYPTGNPAAVPTVTELGVANYYTPLTVNVTAVVNPSSLTVGMTDARMPGADPANSISRYWMLTENGSLTANLTFQYDASDVTGTESTFKVIKNEDGNTTSFPGSTVNTATHTATVNGISDFSLWSVGVLSPTAANGSISGRVLTAEGQGIRNAALTISGGNLTEPRRILTGSFGYYKFDDLEVGQTYIINIKSKRYVFTNPTTVITLQDDVADHNFQAAPQ